MNTDNNTDYDPTIGNGNAIIGRYAGTHKQWESETEWHYHEVWDWIMPIAKNLLFNERWEGPGFEFEDKVSLINDALNTCEVLNVFNAVVEVISWINTKQKTDLEETLVMGWNDYISEVDEPPEDAKTILDVDLKLEGFYNRWQDEIDLYQDL